MPDPGEDADAVREQQDEPRPKRGRSRTGETPQPVERAQHPADSQHRDQDGTGPKHLPEAEPEAPAQRSCDRCGQQGETEENAQHERPDADEFLARLRVHVMRRSA